MQGGSDPAPDPDGLRLLSTGEVGELLEAAVGHGGGTLVSWQVDQIDAAPHHATTATYVAVVDWPSGRRQELLGASARTGGRSPSDERAMIFADGDREVAVWLHPNDPDLPGLPRATRPELFAQLVQEHRLVGVPVAPRQVGLELIGYRPRRRAVVKATVHLPGGPRTFFVKVVRQRLLAPVLRRHEMLTSAGLPAPPVLAVTQDSLLVLGELPGTPLAQAIFAAEPPVRGEQLITLLDAMPTEVAQLDRRRPWAEAVDQYTEMIAASLPALGPRLARLEQQITSGLHGLPAGTEATHGDFHEGQVFVGGGLVSGLLDVDTIGPGRRADDLACLLAHLSTVQRMNPEQAARVQRLIGAWAPVFAARVDPGELRLRTAAVIVSLATGPYRAQEPRWQAETVSMIERAEWFVASAGR